MTRDNEGGEGKREGGEDVLGKLFFFFLKGRASGYRPWNGGDQTFFFFAPWATDECSSVKQARN